MSENITKIAIAVCTAGILWIVSEVNTLGKSVAMLVDNHNRTANLISEFYNQKNKIELIKQRLVTLENKDKNKYIY